MAQTIVIEVPGKSISELEPTSSVSPDDVLPVVQGEDTKKAPLEQVADMVKAGLGSAALKNEDDFAKPDAVNAVAVASQIRDDAQNERIDSVEHGLVAIGNGADKSFATYAEMIAYVPTEANVSVRNNDPDPTKRGTYIWNGSAYVPGYDPLDTAIEYAQGVSDEAKSFTEVSLDEVVQVAKKLPGNYEGLLLPNFGAIDKSGTYSGAVPATYVLAKAVAQATKIRKIIVGAFGNTGIVKIKVFSKSGNQFTLLREIADLHIYQAGVNEFSLKDFGEFVLATNEYLGFSVANSNVLGYKAASLATPFYYSALSASATSFDDSRPGTTALPQVAFYSETDVSRLNWYLSDLERQLKLLQTVYPQQHLGLQYLPVYQSNGANIGQWLPGKPSLYNGSIKRVYVYANVEGTVLVSAYSKSGTTFTRQRSVEINVSVGLNIIDIDLKINAGEFPGLMTSAVGQIAYIQSNSSHDGVYSTGTLSESATFPATPNTGFAFQFSFDIQGGNEQLKPLTGEKVTTFGNSIDWYDQRQFAVTHIEAGQTVIGYQSYMREILGCTIDNKGESGWTMPEIYSARVKPYDYSDVYAVTIHSGANDHRKAIEIGVISDIGVATAQGDEFDTSTYAGALQASIEKIINSNKNTKIFLITPIRGWFYESGTSNVPGPYKGEMTISIDYVNAVKSLGELYGIPVIDWYHLTGFNELNKAEYYGDNPEVFTAYVLHPTQKGFKRMGEIISKFLLQY